MRNFLFGVSVATNIFLITTVYVLRKKELLEAVEENELEKE